MAELTSSRPLGYWIWRRFLRRRYTSSRRSRCPIPGEIGHLHRLKDLSVGNNSFGGAIPVEIRNCTSLQVLDLEGNRLTGEVPGFLGEFRGLRVLSLGNNLFSGLVPASISNLTGLEFLNLGSNIH
ncbi:hypothetical protein NL676_004549 [Syzygium grande]|nr:hypothetical protein NL676_004549 [Syzygium grande]